MGDYWGPMQTKTIKFWALAFLMQFVVAGRSWQLHAQAEKSAYPVMADRAQYLNPDEDSEIALARSAAPQSISDQAEVLVLRRDGYQIAVKGKNGFVCLVERSFGAATDFPEFWNPKIRGPICVNAAAARTYLPAILLKATLAIAGKSKTEIAQAVTSAMDEKKLPPLEPGAMCYMMSKQQYLADDGKNWHPHLMWFVGGDAAKSWGANLLGSPVIAVSDTDVRMTIFLVWAGHWSDGTPAPSAEDHMKH